MTEGGRDKGRHRSWCRKKETDTCVKEQQVYWTGAWITDKDLFKLHFI